MPKVLDLFDLIVNRQFGELDLRENIQRTEIANAFGQPDDESVNTRNQIRQDQPPLIWKYGNFEFHFDSTTDRLRFLFLENLSGEPKCCQNRPIKPWVIHEHLSLSSFQSACESKGISISIENDQWNDGCNLVTCTQAGTTLLFGPNHRQPTSTPLLLTLTVPALQ